MFVILCGVQKGQRSPMKRLSVLLLSVGIALLLGACSSTGSGSSGVFAPSGPTDDEAIRAITQHLAYQNVVIKNKNQCEISNNTKAQGVSERWIITYDGLNTFGTARQETDTKVTIEKYDGTWVLWNVAPYCGS